VLDKVEVLTEQGVLLTLPLQDISQGYSVQDIDGLDPVKATLVSSTFGSMDGEQYQSSRREKRNIVLTLGYEPDYATGTVQDLRKKLYTFFMPKSRVLLRFFQTGEPVYQIYGRVESFDSPKFAKEPTAVISMLCFDPDFYDPTPVILAANTTSSTVETPYIYPGTVESGIIFRLYVNRNDLTEFTIYHRPPDDSLRSLEFGTATPLQSGDLLTISTIPGNKFATLTRGGVDTSFLFGISPQSDWISLFPGTNKLRIYAEGAGIPYQIEYTTKIGAL
jgi:hypothetical protein